MKTTFVTLAAALMLGTSWGAYAQEQDPNAPVILPDQQQGQQGEQPVKKRKKKDQVEQTQQSAPQGGEDQGEQTFKKRKRKEQAEQPSDQMQPSAEGQDQQTFKKRKRKEQAEQPSEQMQPSAEDQDQQTFKKRKRKEQAEQPSDQMQPSAEDQDQQTFKKRKKREQAEQPAEPSAEGQDQQTFKKRKRKEQAEQPVDQNQPSVEDQNQPSVEDQNQQTFKKRRKEQAEQPVDQNQPSVGGQDQQTFKKRKKEQAGQPVDQNRPSAEDQNQQTFKKRKKEQAEQPVDQTQPPSEQSTGQPQSEPPTAGNVPPEVTQYLSDTRSMKQLSDEELTQRARAGHDLSRMKGLSDDVRRKLAAEGRKARQEAMARAQGGTAKGDQEQQGREQPVFGQPPTGETAKGGQGNGQGEGQATLPPGEAVQANPDKKQVQQLDGNKGSPEAENKARAYLDDPRRADQLNDDQLRDRLEGMRALMAGNQLSADSERELRRRLRTEREILRNRVSRKVVTEEDKGDVVPGRKLRGDIDEHKWDNWSERDVLRDRRRSEDLQEGELRRRIDVYRVAIYDDRYDEEERAYWRGMMDRDRMYLRERLINDRRERERYWHDRRDRNDLNIEININLEQDREPPEAVFMDEIDDDDLETYLVAAPRRRIDRRYTVEEIEREPELRTAMPAIEIDNIHFGFNESFVREEEVDKLDRIAEVIEKILAAHPGEVFLIAGYTDAVGSPEYNLGLSRERAEAVKKALTTYYVIPARNLKTVGYGERYLKIPTAEAEEENRRVSLQRVTPLVGEADEAAEAE